jgi:putative hydrolase of the HAD superfamily
VPVRWIVLDAVGTLIYATPDVPTAYFEIGRRHGSRLSRADVTARFREAFRESEGRDLESAGGETGRTDEATEEKRWRRIVAEVLPDTASADACFQELFAHFGLPESWACFDDVQPTLDLLRKRGLEIAIASNFDARLHSVCDGLSQLTAIRHRVVSSEVGFRKPCHSFYDALLDEIRASPDEVLMVGDDLENDVRGAESAGIRAVLIRRCEGSPPDGVTSVKSLLELEAVL